MPRRLGGHGGGCKHWSGRPRPIKMTETTLEHKCPRRIEAPWAKTDPAMDRWFIVHDRRLCSYCGALHPDEFMTLVAAGCELGPTDKSYKVYLEPKGWHGKFYFQHITDEQRVTFIELYNSDVMKLGYPGSFYVTPYFMKLKPKMERD